MEKLIHQLAPALERWGAESPSAPRDRGGRSAAFRLGVARAERARPAIEADADPVTFYVFQRSLGTWSETARFGASDAAPSDSFGKSVSLTG